MLTPAASILATVHLFGMRHALREQALECFIAYASSGGSLSMSQLH